MSEYEELRIDLDRGFSVDNLRSITNHAIEILRQNVPRHPAIPLIIAILSRWIADSWDEKALSVDVANRVESQIKPHFQKLLSLADSDAAEVYAAVNETALAFSAAICSGLDSDLI